MDQQLFTDGIGRITVIGGVVRLDLVTYSPIETDANGQPRAVLTQRVVMGVDAFLRSSEKVVETVQHITQAQMQKQPAPHYASIKPQAAAPRPTPQPAPQAAPQPAPEPPPRKPPFP